jgi:hypothetical protein
LEAFHHVESARENGKEKKHATGRDARTGTGGPAQEF